jgi:hypothetical protein
MYQSEERFGPMILYWTMQMYSVFVLTPYLQSALFQFMRHKLHVFYLLLVLQTSWHTQSFIEPPYEVLCCKTTLTRQYNAWYAAHCLILVACCTHSLNKVKQNGAAMTLNSATAASQNDIWLLPAFPS